MGILDTILGNASEMDAASLQKEYGPLLCEGEFIEKAFRLIRDKWVFTNKRLIIQDIQGITGKKKEYMSIPYRSIERFSVETAGVLDLDSELELWFSGLGKVKFEFTGNADVAAICRSISGFVLQ